MCKVKLKYSGKQWKDIPSVDGQYRLSTPDTEDRASVLKVTRKISM